jgi:hypothetical protein
VAGGCTNSVRLLASVRRVQAVEQRTQIQCSDDQRSGGAKRSWSSERCAIRECQTEPGAADHRYDQKMISFRPCGNPMRPPAAPECYGTRSARCCAPGQQRPRIACVAQQRSCHTANRRLNQSARQQALACSGLRPPGRGPTLCPSTFNGPRLRDLRFRPDDTWADPLAQVGSASRARGQRPRPPTKAQWPRAPRRLPCALLTK